MTNKFLGIILLLTAPAIAAAQAVTSVPAPSQQKNPEPPAQAKATPAVPHTNLKVGEAAPDFTLPSTIVQDGKRIRYKLSDFRGKKNVVLAFYVFAFTGG